MDWTDFHKFPNSTASLNDGPPVVDNDVFTVRDYLSYLVPIEIADIFLTFALFWPCSAVSTHIPRQDRVFFIPASYELECNAAVYFMVTPAIPPGKRAIQAVRFTLLSNDQGQAPDIDIEENLRGTYQGSNTWFEAAIIRDDREEVPQYLFQVRQPRQPIDAFNRDAFTREQAREIKNSLKGTERWQLQYNVQAVCTPKLYQIVWMKGEVINDEVEAVSRSKGAGTGRGFVSTLRPGDRVALVLRAQHQGWANCIWGAEIEILHSV